ncbi:large subunit ribosomal protein L10 [Sphingomonas sp. PvP056]
MPWFVTGRAVRGMAKKVENGMDRAQKTELVAELNRSFAEVGVVIVTRNLGMTVSQSTKLRNAMRDAGASYKVSKNKLAKIALDGTDYTPLGDMLTGPVGLASSIDPVAAAKVAVEFAKTNDKFEIVGGAMGATVLDVDGVKALATMPSLDELRAKIVGLLVAPATKLATIAQAPAAQLARVLSAYAEKDAEQETADA